MSSLKRKVQIISFTGPINKIGDLKTTVEMKIQELLDKGYDIEGELIITYFSDEKILMNQKMVKYPPNIQIKAVVEEETFTKAEVIGLLSLFEQEYKCPPTNRANLLEWFTNQGFKEMLYPTKL